MKRISNNQKKKLVKEYQKLMNTKWKKDLVIAQSEKRRKKFNFLILKILAPIYIKSVDPLSDKWTVKMKELVRKDKKRKKEETDLLKKGEIECWIKMHSTSIPVLEILKRWKKIHLKANKYKKDFLKKPTFHNFKLHFNQIDKSLKLMSEYKDLLKNKAKHQRRLLKIMAKHKKEFKTSALLQDFIGSILTGSIIPISTSFEIIRIFGTETWAFLLSFALQTKAMEDMANKMRDWERLIRKDREKLIKKYQI